MTNWSENSHLYNYTGSVYLPCGAGGQAWQWIHLIHQS
jgi:hypothetical protein